MVFAGHEVYNRALNGTIADKQDDGRASQDVKDDVFAKAHE